MRTPKSQRGIALVVSLLMLTLMTLIVLSAIRTTSVDLKVVGNVQERLRLEASVQVALNRVLSEANAAGFVSGTEKTYTDLDPEVTVQSPNCIGTAPASGYSARQNIVPPEDTVWQLIGSALDSLSGADTTMTQGVRIRLHNGVCYDHP